MKKWNRRVIFLYVVCFFAARFCLGQYFQTGQMESLLHPYVMALLACMCLEVRLPRRLSFLVLAAGVVSSEWEAIFRYGISMLTFLFVAGLAEGGWSIRLDGKKEGSNNLDSHSGSSLSLPAMALLAGIVTAGVGIGGGLYAVGGVMLPSVAEGLLTAGLTVVLWWGVHFILYPPEREHKNSENAGREVISIVLLVLGALCGLPELMNGFSLVYPGAVLAVLLLGYYYGIGAGTMAGALAGTVIAIRTGDSELVGLFALCSMVSCVMRELGKIPVSLTWLMSTAIIGFLWNDFFLQREGVFGIIPALILFLLLPGERKQMVAEKTEPIYTNMQAVAREKLQDVSTAFHKLSALMAYPSHRQEGLSGGDMNRIFHLVSEKCCTDCERKAICMRSEFFDTYHQVFEILDKAEREGKIFPEQVPKAFYSRCIRSDYFLFEAGLHLELARTNLAWQNRMMENRVMVAEQFAGVAGMMDEVVLELGMDTRQYDKSEKQVLECVNAVGVETCQVLVRQREDKRMEIFLTARMPEGNCITTRDLAALLGAATKRNFHASQGSKSVISGEWATVVLLEDTAFRFFSGVASCSREGEPQSGDSHSIRELPGGEAVLLLSDGMGSGPVALQESSKMVELLEQFLDAGMDSASAMKVIWSSLFLRENGENFTTVDLFRVDLCSGICRFLKVGAADSFLIHGTKLERLSVCSLPAGILSLQEAWQQELEEETIKLCEGDFLVMVTDGFLECFPEGQEEEAILSIVGGRRQNNANELAHMLLDCALIYCGGSPADDITVLVTGFWGNEKNYK